MTNKEAIKILDQCVLPYKCRDCDKLNGKCDGADRVFEAVDMAIDAICELDDVKEKTGR